MEVLSASCLKSSVDDNGKVSGGYVTLRGKVLSSILHYIDSPGAQCDYTSSPPNPVSQREDKAASWEAGSTPKGTSSWKPPSIRIHVDTNLSLPSESLTSGSKVYFLLLARSTISYTPEMNVLYGVLIRQLPETYAVSLPGQEVDLSSRTFVRIGHGCLCHDRSKNPDEVLASLEDYEDMVITIV